MNAGTIGLVSALALAALAYIGRWWALERRRGQRLDLPEERTASARARQPRFTDALVGFITNFFDTLGIGSFAPTTAYFKLRARMPDEQIPGTLNAGQALPTMTQALIFIATVSVDLTTLVSMILAAVLGAWLGVGLVARLSRRAIQLGMGGSLMCAAALFLAANLHWMPGGGEALGLSGSRLIVAVAANALLGALMMLGVGLYAPCLILVSLLGMSPLAAFPIMMGSCGLLMPIGGARFVRSGRYNLGAALGLALGGIPGVLVAAYIVKSLPIVWLRWLVLAVVVYAAFQMLRSARRRQPKEGDC
ncbi:MAG TPA: sulfite exporter TauE/SafE family protein [Steroidobacteraceae bacterium]